jgi:hypothetical protein
MKICLLSEEKSSRQEEKEPRTMHPLLGLFFRFRSHAPWLRRLLSTVKEDPAEGARPLPWFTPSLVPEKHTLTLTSSENVRRLYPNRYLSFCQGAIVDGEPQPFVVGVGILPTHFCQNLFLSIANPRVYHSALHSGSDSHKKFGLHTFPKSILRQLATALGIQWLSPFTLPLRTPSGDAPEAAPARTTIPKNLTIRFEAHRASVYGSSAAAKMTPFDIAAYDHVRESHAKDYLHKHV